MVKRFAWMGLAVAGVFVLNGCATMKKNDSLENQGLRNKVSALEMQLSETQNELNSLKELTAKNEQEAGQNAGDIKQQIDPKQIQAALKNAGYYQGEVDGKLGRKTRRAIRAFQKANNLHADGKVGKNTWIVLKEYLEKKVK